MEHETLQPLDLSVPIHQLPVWVYGLSVILFIVPLLVYALVRPNVMAGFFMGENLLYLVVLIVGHEAVHALGWKTASGLPWSKFKFGIAWRALAPYCHATEPMSVAAYRFGAALPAFITGILPVLLAIVLANPGLAFIGAVLCSGAVGDVYVLWTLRDIPADALVQDHSENAGCIVYLPRSGATV
jgi:hypothetical protein